MAAPISISESISCEDSGCHTWRVATSGTLHRHKWIFRRDQSRSCIELAAGNQVTDSFDAGCAINLQTNSPRARAKQRALAG